MGGAKVQIMTVDSTSRNHGMSIRLTSICHVTIWKGVQVSRGFFTQDDKLYIFFKYYETFYFVP
jgi:hypothetical protein